MTTEITLVLCPECGHRMHKMGMVWSGRHQIQRFRCPACGRTHAPKSTILTIICAWCGKDMGTKDGQGTTGTSHGICAECSKKFTNDEKGIGQ